MPVTVRKRRGKYRVIEAKTGHIAKSKKGNASDGGGHIAKIRATRQATAINAAYARKRKK